MSNIENHVNEDPRLPPTEGLCSERFITTVYIKGTADQQTFAKVEQTFRLLLLDVSKVDLNLSIRAFAFWENHAVLLFGRPEVGINKRKKSNIFKLVFFCGR